MSFVTVHPMSFYEFAEAMGEEKLVELVRTMRWDRLDFIASRLETLLKLYYFIGGMPEVVASFAANNDFTAARAIQQQILDSYDRDFSKHAPIKEVPRIRMVWQSVIGQLAKENKKFIYGFLKEGARAKDFELALEWLQDAGLIHKVYRTKKGLLPLSAYEDFAAFKVYMSDTRSSQCHRQTARTGSAYADRCVHRL